MANGPKILFYGYGNPGRKDDGLGPALAELMEEWKRSDDIRGLYTDSNYQLNIEDAYNIRDYDYVIFLDASTEDIDGFLITKVVPAAKVNFTMHSVSPSFVLHLCRQLYDHYPETWLLHIRGFDFNLEEGLSDLAKNNLSLAFDFSKKLTLNLQKGNDIFAGKNAF